MVGKNPVEIGKVSAFLVIVVVDRDRRRPRRFIQTCSPSEKQIKLPHTCVQNDHASSGVGGGGTVTSTGGNRFRSPRFASRSRSRRSRSDDSEDRELSEMARRNKETGAITAKLRR